MQAFVPHECMVSIRSNACIRANQMGAFVPIKCMQLYVTNAGSRVQGDWQGGECFALRELLALAFCVCNVSRLRYDAR